jgi:hypothetical protein
LKGEKIKNSSLQGEVRWGWGYVLVAVKDCDIKKEIKAAFLISCILTVMVSGWIKK